MIADATLTAADLQDPPAIVRHHQRRWLWRQPPASLSFDDAERLGVERLMLNSFIDSAVLPGDDATPEAIDRSQNRQAAEKLIDRFASEGFSWSGERVHRASLASAEASKTFLGALPSDIGLPRLAPDSEGSITAVWDNGDNPIIVTFDGWRLHFIIGATTPNARYFDDLDFSSREVPQAALQALNGYRWR